MAVLQLLLTSPRVPAGLLSRDAWRALESADLVLARALDDELPAALADAGVAVESGRSEAWEPENVASFLVQRAQAGSVVWIGSLDGDPGLTDALATELSGLPDPPEVEVIVGSWDQPDARLLDAVAVMDALRSEGGDPWSAEQTHASLADFLIEEAHETLEAIEARDNSHLAEELGDVLFQVLFHSRVAAERGEDGFNVDDVAALLVDKLIRRNPHVFGDAQAATSAEVEVAWEQIKAEEKPSRGSDLLEGIPAGLSTLLAAQKVLVRAQRRGIDLGIGSAQVEGDLGDAIFAIVEQCRQQGVSADQLLRAAVKRAGSPN